MPYRDTVTLDIASTGISNAADFIDKASIKVPGNYTKPDSIAKFVEEEYTRRVAEAGLDLDLAQVTAVGVQVGDSEPIVNLCETSDQEVLVLTWLAGLLGGNVPPTIITYGGSHFDLPLLMRRARYLNVGFPVLNLDRYRSPHLDLLQILSDRDPARRRSLGFYVRRLGWSDLFKPLSGADEALAPSRGDWAGLMASVHHDVTACRRLAQWMGLLEPVSEPVL